VSRRPLAGVVAVCILVSITVFTGTLAIKHDPAVRATPVPTDSTAVIDTPQPTATAYPTDTPTLASVPTDTPSALAVPTDGSNAPTTTDTNQGVASDAVLGGNASNFVAKFGAPGGGFAMFVKCGDGRYGNYLIKTSDYPAKNPAFGSFVPNHSGSQTEIVMSINGGMCDQASHDPAAMLNDARQFFPPDASEQIGSCTEKDGSAMYTYFTSATFANDWHYSTPSLVGTDCSGAPLPVGTFAFVAYAAAGGWDDR
jgi:hypothetical protein